MMSQARDAGLPMGCLKRLSAKYNLAACLSTTSGLPLDGYNDLAQLCLLKPNRCARWWCCAVDKAVIISDNRRS